MPDKPMTNEHAGSNYAAKNYESNGAEYGFIFLPLILYLHYYFYEEICVVYDLIILWTTLN
jgi:hypothetical protein